MKISNFSNYTTTGLGWDLRHYANVNVTTGILWWRKTESKAVCKEVAGCWFFVDTGKFTPGFEVDDLYRAYTSRKALENALKA